MAKARPKKLGGLLLLFVVLFVLAGIGEIYIFFNALGSTSKTAVDTLQMVLDAFIGLGLLVSSVQLISRKKSALPLVYLTLGVMAAYSVLNNLNADQRIDDSLEFIGLVTAPLLYGLCALYFKQSNRVKQTLVN